MHSSPVKVGPLLGGINIQARTVGDALWTYDLALPAAEGLLLELTAAVDKARAWRGPALTVDTLLG